MKKWIKWKRWDLFEFCVEHRKDALSHFSSISALNFPIILLSPLAVGRAVCNAAEVSEKLPELHIFMRKQDTEAGS